MRRPDGLAWGVVAVVLVGHALMFGSWIVDDAGISFAYARNLASGHGLVSQPGAPPVEGFSNFAWVLLLTPFFAMGLFDPMWTPKLLGLAALGATFVVLCRTFRVTAPPGQAGALVVCALLALNTSFVAWGISGLENPLYALGAAVTLTFTVEALVRNESEPHTYPRRSAVLAGLATAGVAMTRPDGVLYAAAFPLAAGWLGLRSRTRQTPEDRAPGRASLILLHGISFGLPFGSFLLFRRLYFGRWLPNTFFAKVGPVEEGGLARRILDNHVFAEIVTLFRAAAGHAPLAVVGMLAVATLAAVATVVAAGRLRDVHRVWLVFAALAASAFVLLPPDWMGEHRFATPFFLFFYGLAVMIGDAALRYWRARSREGWGSRLHWSIKAVGAGLILSLVLSFFQRSREFAQDPTVSFQTVATTLAHRFDRYATQMDLDEASILLPDVGGMLYTSRLRVYDLAGLLDPEIARTLGRDLPALHDHVFEILRPTFIHTHDHWSAVSRFDLDSRFFRDYVPLVGYFQPIEGGDAALSGDFLRRDVAEEHPQTVAQIRRELTESRRRPR